MHLRAGGYLVCELWLERHLLLPWFHFEEELGFAGRFFTFRGSRVLGAYTPKLRLDLSWFGILCLAASIVKSWLGSCLVSFDSDAISEITEALGWF